MFCRLNVQVTFLCLMYGVSFLGTAFKLTMEAFSMLEVAGENKTNLLMSENYSFFLSFQEWTTGAKEKKMQIDFSFYPLHSKVYISVKINNCYILATGISEVLWR